MSHHDSHQPDPQLQHQVTAWPGHRGQVTAGTDIGQMSDHDTDRQLPFQANPGGQALPVPTSGQCPTTTPTTTTGGPRTW